MSVPRLYSDLAYLWPILSPPDDYVAEAEVVRSVLRERLGQGRLKIVEFGAGGGHTLVHLAHEFDVAAVDLSDAMLRQCEKLVPSATCMLDDMRDVDLRDTFDAVLIHDAIDYLVTEDDLLETFRNAHRHLRDGGVLLVAPTYTKETFAEHETASDHRDGDNYDVTYFSYVHDPDPDDTTFELILVYLIRRAGSVKIEHDKHRCGLFPLGRWMKLLREAGFAVEPARQAENDSENAGLPGAMLVATKRDARPARKTKPAKKSTTGTKKRKK